MALQYYVMHDTMVNKATTEDTSTSLAAELTGYFTTLLMSLLFELSYLSWFMADHYHWQEATHLIDPFTVSLHSPKALTAGMPAVRAVQGDCQWPLKYGGNSHQSHQPTMHYSLLRMHWNVGIPNLYLDEPTTQAMPPVNPMFGLCNGLPTCRLSLLGQWINLHQICFPAVP